MDYRVGQEARLSKLGFFCAYPVLVSKCDYLRVGSSGEGEIRSSLAVAKRFAMWWSETRVAGVVSRLPEGLWRKILNTR